jgi:hypothetical protein
MLRNAAPNVFKLPIDALESRRPLRPILDTNYPNLHALPFLEPGRIHFRLSLWSRVRVRLRLSAALHRSVLGVHIWTCAASYVVVGTPIPWRRGMERCRSSGNMGIWPVCLDTCFGVCFLRVTNTLLTSHMTLIQILCVIPVPLLRWILVFVAFGLSGFFLIINIYPILATVRVVYIPTFQSTEFPFVR